MAGTAGARIVRLTDFASDDGIARWQPIDDVVMGGISHSSFTRSAPGIARFAGHVSLKNNGGFASVRTRPAAWDTAGASAFWLRVLGDGRTYKFTLRVDDGFDGVQYQQRFAPPAGEWSQVRLPVGSFVASFRGRPVPGAPPLPVERVRTLGLMISDRQAGRFELQLAWVGAEKGGNGG